jgi:hypothetical protein
MINRYSQWQNNSSEWRIELERKLSTCDKLDFIIDYKTIALAFPSFDPHPKSFDYPIIDSKSFLDWAKSKQYKVEIVSSNDSTRRAVRFTKLQGLIFSYFTL